MASHFFRRPLGDSKLEFKKMQPQLKRIKDKSYPIKPTNWQEIRECFQNEEIFSRFGHTLNKENKFYVDTVVNENSSFCLFASYATMNLIEKYIPPRQRNF